MDKGPFRVFKSGVTEYSIYSDDFRHDASLKVFGDFESLEQKRDYAQWVADVLNAHVAQTNQ